MRRPWTEDEMARLRSSYAESLTADLAREMGRSECALYSMAQSLGLSKSADWVAEQSRRHSANPAHGGVPTRFRTGQVPQNKGLRRPGWAPGDMARTQFKVGRPPQEARNYMPIGALRTTRDGIVERKVTDDPSISPARRWVAEARLVWAAAMGPIPAGHAVVFRPGQHTTDPELITVDRLEMLSRRDLMLRNTLHRYGPEVSRLIRIRAALARQINIKSKEVQDGRQQ